MSLNPPPLTLSRRDVLGGGAALAAGELASGSAHGTPKQDSLLLNDASGLNPTRVARHFVLTSQPGEDRLVSLRRLLAEAAAENRAVVVGGARHSMGGQSLYGSAFAITDASADCAVDTAARRCRLSAGARWRHVVRQVDQLGLSVAVMQSNSDFSLGGTLSVNGHGWAVPYGAFAETVRAFSLMRADGAVVRCSPSENPDLFRGAIGGYGLLGILIDAELHLADNALLSPRFDRMPAAALGQAFSKAVQDDPALRMAYGRLSTAPDAFLREALLVTFRDGGGRPEPVPAGEAHAFGMVTRAMLRGQTGSDRGKRARWWAETRLGPRLAPLSVTRNRLLVQPVSSLGSPGVGRTDILHEYFLPPAALSEFLAACRRRMPAHGQDLLNVTLRYVAADPVSLMTFAPAPRIAAVMLFSQARTAADEIAMRRLTEELIEEALAVGGSFYLPYRLHARRDQVARAYPALPELLELKRRYDPRGRFRNLMFDAYLG
jgi:FAD/FMN-containing dehydrogenase